MNSHSSFELVNLLFRILYIVCGMIGMICLEMILVNLKNINILELSDVERIVKVLLLN